MLTFMAFVILAFAASQGPFAQDRSGTGALMAKYQGTLPALLEERTDMSPELIRISVQRYHDHAVLSQDGSE